MKSRTAQRAVGVAVSLVLSAPVLAIASPAQAAGCEGAHYNFSDKRSNHIGTKSIFTNGPGGTMSSTIQQDHTAELGVSASFSVSASGLVASASAEFGINASVSSSKGQSWVYSHNISPGKYGHMQFGNWGWKMDFTKVTKNYRCEVLFRESGTVNKMPSGNDWGFRYWETN